MPSFVLLSDVRPLIAAGHGARNFCKLISEAWQASMGKTERPAVVQ